MRDSEKYFKRAKFAFFGWIASFIALFSINLVEIAVGGTREYIVQYGIKTLTSSVVWLRIPNNIAGVSIFISMFAGLYFFKKYVDSMQSEYKKDIDSILNELGFSFKCDNCEVKDIILDGNVLIDHKHSTYRYRIYSESGIEIFGDMKVCPITEYGDNLSSIFEGYCIKLNVFDTQDIDVAVHTSSYTSLGESDYRDGDYVCISNSYDDNVIYTIRNMDCDKDRIITYFTSLKTILGEITSKGLIMFIRDGVVYLYVNCGLKDKKLPSEKVKTLLKVINVEF